MAAPRVDHFRSQARIPLVAELTVSPLGATYELAARLVDLGLGGACFELSERFEPGQRLRLELELPGLWDNLTVHGEVAWQRPLESGGARVGVRFTRPTGQTLRILAENLAALQG